MSTAATRPPAIAVERTRRPAARAAAAALTPREAALRSAATACLTAIALVLGIELSGVLARRAVLGALLLGAMALCVGAGLALVAATASASRQVWRTVAATAALVLAGWGLPHAVALPGPAGARGDWAAMPGVACAGLATACLVLAAAAARPARGLAVALAVLVAWGPGAAAFVIATGPSPPGGEAAIPAGVHAHGSSTAAEPVIVSRPGRNGDHFVTRVSTPRRAPAAGVALLAAGAALFVACAVTSLRRRSATAG